MECYGQYHKKKNICKKCKLKKWCIEASDPPRLSHQMLDWDSLSEHAKPADSAVKQPVELLYNIPEPEKAIYTRSDLLEVIGFLIALDTQTLEMLDCKIGNSGLSFSDIARKRGISRQAVHKYIKKKCAQIPELSIVLQNNSQKRKPTSFMEEVCRIQRQRLRKKSKKQKADSKFSRKLICWNPSLDLSKMSIFRGSRITGSASKAWE